MKGIENEELEQFKLLLPKLSKPSRKPICKKINGNGFKYGEFTTQLRDIINEYQVIHTTVKNTNGLVVDGVNKISDGILIVNVKNEQFNLISLNKEWIKLAPGDIIKLGNPTSFGKVDWYFKWVKVI